MHVLVQAFFHAHVPLMTSRFLAWRLGIPLDDDDEDRGIPVLWYHTLMSDGAADR